MTAALRLPGPDYVRFIAAESSRFIELLADANPSARVPACPDWDAADLLWHLTEVQWFWGSIVSRRLSDYAPAEADKPDRPSDLPGLVGLARDSTDRLVTSLSEGGDGDPMWTWLEGDQTRGFVRRRQAHEALIHRLDAEQAVDDVTSLDPALATDGVDEALRIMFGGTPSWGRFDWRAGPVSLTTGDTQARWTVAVGRVSGTTPDGEVVDEPSLEIEDGRAADPVAQVTAADAGTLDAWLWGRLPTSGLTRSGDEAALRAFDEVVGTGVQ